jgi:hypothetical protein
MRPTPGRPLKQGLDLTGRYNESPAPVPGVSPSACGRSELQSVPRFEAQPSARPWALVAFEYWFDHL